MFTFITQFVLLAAKMDWVQVLIAVVVFVIWGINHLISGLGKPKPQQRPKPMPRGNAPQPNKPAPAQNLAGEIDDFLKRATQKRQEKSRRKQPAAAKQAPTVPPPKPVQRLSDTATSNQDFEIRTRHAISDDVQEHLDNRQFGERAAHLVDEDILQDDADREAHRTKVFDHQLGRLVDTSNLQSDKQISAQAASRKATTDSAAAAAIPIASMLANPESLKQAIVLNEILTRPEHRW